jgi:DnaJ-class molecular chaperone
VKIMTLYNQILGVSITASQAEIRESFRRLALKHHPDRNKNSEEAKQKFLKILEAYEVLSDKQTRKKYDDENNIYVNTRGDSYISTQRYAASVASERLNLSYTDIRRRYMQME